MPRGQSLNEPHYLNLLLTMQQERTPLRGSRKADLTTANIMDRGLRFLGPTPPLEIEIWVPREQVLGLQLSIGTNTETPSSYSLPKLTYAMPESNNCTTDPQNRERARPPRLLKLHVNCGNHRGTRYLILPCPSSPPWAHIPPPKFISSTVHFLDVLYCPKKKKKKIQ